MNVEYVMEMGLLIIVDAVMNYLIIDKNGIYLDGTIGFGGHADAILKDLGPNGKYIGLDADPYALEYAKKRLSVHAAFCTLHHVNYRNFPEVLASLEIPQVTGLFFDIGTSSYQIDSRARGFSYIFDSPLDMRFDNSKNYSACYFDRLSPPCLQSDLWCPQRRHSCSTTDYV